MEWILVAGYTFLFLAIIRKLNFFKSAIVTPRWIIIAFLVKIGAGIILGLIYTYYYTDRSTADTYKFFDDSLIIFNTLFSHPWDFFRMFTGWDANDPGLRHYYESMNAWLNTDVIFNDNKTIIRLNTLFRFFSLGYYFVHVVFLNFISFTGIMMLFKLFSKYVAGKVKELFFILFFLPSVLFWGSGLLKDGLLLFALGGLLFSYHRIVQYKLQERKEQKKNVANFIRTSLFFLICFVLLIFTKLYVLVSIFPGLIAWYWSKSNHGRKIFLKFALVYSTCIFLAFNIQYILPRFDLADILYYKQKNFYVLAEATQARSVIQIPHFEPSFISILLNSPMAFINALMRPTIPDAGMNPLILLSAFENIGIFLLILLVLITLRKPTVEIDSFIVCCIVFVILIFTLVGLITPILGALVRYRISALPFLVFLLVYFADKERILKLFRREDKVKQ